MKIQCLACGYNSYGGAIHTWAAEHLQASVKSIEPQGLLVELVAFLPHSGPVKPTLEGYLERHNKRFPQKIRAIYRAKAEVLKLDYPSELTRDESFVRRGGISGIAQFLPKALDELGDAVLEGLRSKPALWKLVEEAELASAIEASRNSLPVNEADLIAYLQQMTQARKAAASANTTVDDLDIDWRHYHHCAKKVLNLPFFWSEVDEDAPHGNDTGSDLFAAFKRWDKKNPEASYNGYVDRLFSRWGLTGAKTHGMVDEDHLRWLRQEGDIALAFAAIKLRGSCQKQELCVAIAALEERIARFQQDEQRARKFVLLKEKLTAQLPT